MRTRHDAGLTHPPDTPAAGTAGGSGDNEAFAEIYSHFRDPLVRYCQSRLHNFTEAEDAVEETFLRAYVSLANRDRDGDVTPWLFVIARNICTDLQRRHQRDDARNLPAPRSSTDTEELVLAELDADRARAAIGRLPLSQRETFALRSDGGMSSAEIASITGLSMKQVDLTVYRVRQRLRHALGVGAPAAVVGGWSHVRLAFSRLRARAAALARHPASAVSSEWPQPRVLSLLALTGILAGGATLAVHAAAPARPHPSHPVGSGATGLVGTTGPHRSADRSARVAAPVAPGAGRATLSVTLSVTPPATPETSGTTPLLGDDKTTTERVTTPAPTSAAINPPTTGVAAVTPGVLPILPTPTTLVTAARTTAAGIVRSTTTGAATLLGDAGQDTKTTLRTARRLHDRHTRYCGLDDRRRRHHDLDGGQQHACGLAVDRDDRAGLTDGDVYSRGPDDDNTPPPTTLGSDLGRATTGVVAKAGNGLGGVLGGH